MSSALTPAASSEAVAESAINRNGTPEHLAALHLELAAHLGVQRFLCASVGHQVPTEELTVALHCFEHGSSGAVGEEDRRCCGRPSR